MKPLLTTRLCIFALSSLATIGTLIVGGPESSFALDPLPRSPRVGSWQIPLGSYERIPIGKLLSNPTSYRLHEIRIAGTVRIVQTQIKTRGCGKPYRKLPRKVDKSKGELSGRIATLSQEVPMRQSKFTETQIVSILKEADAGRPVNEIWRSYGISSATYYKWKAKYGGLEASDIKRLKELEHENGCLKRMYADLSLENAALKDVIAKKL
jgi:putative transposase